MSDVQTRVHNIVRDFLDLESEVRPTDLLEDLDADSLDRIELVMAIEDEFDIEISDEEVDRIRKVENFTELVHIHLQGKDE